MAELSHGVDGGYGWIRFCLSNPGNSSSSQYSRASWRWAKSEQRPEIAPGRREEPFTPT